MSLACPPVCVWSLLNSSDMVRDPCDDVGEPAAKAYVSKLRAVEAEADDDDEDDDDQNNTNNRDSRVSEHLKQEMVRHHQRAPKP